MRPLKAGLALILLLIAALVIGATTTRADIKGEVESIGFNATYRPDTHTPMIVRLQPQGTETGFYQIQVRQKDLDGDTAIFTRTISVTGGEGSREQRFWMDFVPQPTGLPDPAYGETLKDLQKQLRVYLYRNGKEVAYLPVTNTINNIEPKPSSFSTRRGTRLVLFVHDGHSLPSWDEYDKAQGLLGVLEDVIFMPVRVSELPENPLGYDAVDAVLWLNVDPQELKRNGDVKFRCLESYVRQGGNLVICQSPEWQKTLEFGDLLPVELKGVENRDTLEPLKSLAHSQGPREVRDRSGTHVIDDPWQLLKGPFPMARAKAKPGAVVDEWISWDDKGKDRTPYIARQPVGLGAVTWVAQDLGDPSITSRAKTGWVFVWDKVFDWHNSPMVVDNATSQEQKAPWAATAGVDAGQWLSEGMELPSTVAILIATAIAFFLVYWVVAGPGFTCTWLASDARTSVGSCSAPARLWQRC